MLYFFVLSLNQALYARLKAQNAFDVLANEALKGYETGETVDLREFAKNREFELNE